MPTMKRNSAFIRPVVWLIAGALLLGCGWVWRLCQYDSGYPFLPRLGPAEWIVYPKPPDATPHNATPFWAVFRRSFKLEALPPAATLSVRAFKQGAVHINGRPWLPSRRPFAPATRCLGANRWPPLCAARGRHCC